MKINFLMIFTILFLSLFFVYATNAQISSKSDKDEKKIEKQKGDKPLKITGKTPPSTSVFSKCFNTDARRTYLTIRLRVTFHASGKITNVEIMKPSGCNYFDEEAIRVAKKTKFKPATEDGKPVTVTKSLEYSSGIH